MPNKKRNLLSLLLALSLLAGCAAGPESSPPPEPPPESVSQPAPESRPEPPAALAPEEEAPLPSKEEEPDLQEGMTLFAVSPTTGEKEILLENRHWNGLDREAVSPSGSRILTASRMGGLNGGWWALLSLYDITDNRLVNLEPPRELWEEGAGSFDGIGTFFFWDEDTLFYNYIFPPAEGETAVHVLFYQIEEDASLTPRVVRLEAPPLAESFRNFGRFPNTRYLAKRNILLFPAVTEMGPEWLAWELEEGRFLGRSPAENAPEDAANAGILRNGHLYGTTENVDELTFDLWAYDIAADTMEVLGTGPLVLSDPQRTKPSMGWPRPLHIIEVRSARVFRLRAGWPQDPEGYWEALWDRDKGGPILFTEYPPEPASPLLGEENGATVLSTLPDGRLLVLEQS